ncbi:hypothetical protein Q7P35_003670 [Cladosporium inversicolor]
MCSQQGYHHDEDSDIGTLSSSESLIISQYLDAHSELHSSSCSSYRFADTQPYGIIDPERDAEDILAFISTIDAASHTNETGWTRENASLALDAKRRRCESSSDGHDPERSNFEFFSHFDLVLRGQLRLSYNRRKRWGYTGDAQRAMGLDDAKLQIAKLHHLMNALGVAIDTSAQELHDLVNAIGVAIDTPARESHGQMLRRKDREDIERANRELDEFDGIFEGTWKGVLNSTIALGSVMGNYVRKRIVD